MQAKANPFKVGDKIQVNHIGMTFSGHLLDEGRIYEVAEIAGNCVVIKGCYKNGQPPTSGLNYTYFNQYMGEPISTDKASNPKDALAGIKLDFSCVPATAGMLDAVSFMEGATKYGKFNWRHVGVSLSVYTSALKRHLEKFISGEECDPLTRVPHLASIRACAAIIYDAQVHGTLTDDRPDPSPVEVSAQESLAEVQQHLKKLNADKKPKHYTRNRDAV